MSLTATYEGLRGKWTFTYPTISVRHAFKRSASEHNMGVTEKLITLRSYIICATSKELQSEILRAEQLLGQVGGSFIVSGDDYSVYLLENPRTDVDFGPYPDGLEIQQMAGGRMALITWQLRTRVRSKPVGPINSIPTVPLVDFAYGVESALDANFFITRTITGYMEFDGCLALEHGGADVYRRTIEEYGGIYCPSGWERVIQQYKVSENKKIITFVIIDRQVNSGLPKNVTSGDFAFEVQRIPEQPGSFTVDQLQVGLSGWFMTDKLHDVTHLIEAVNQLIIAIILADKKIAAITRLDKYAVKYHPRHNRLEFNVSWLTLNRPEVVWSISPDEKSNKKLFDAKLMFVHEVLAQCVDWVKAHRNSAAPTITQSGFFRSYGLQESAGDPAKFRILPPINLASLTHLYADGCARRNANLDEDGVDDPFRSTGSPGGTKRDDVELVSFYEERGYLYKSGELRYPVLSPTAGDIIQRVGKDLIILLIKGAKTVLTGVCEAPPPPIKQMSSGTTTTPTTSSVDIEKMGGLLRKATVTHLGPDSAGERTVTWEYEIIMHSSPNLEKSIQVSPPKQEILPAPASATPATPEKGKLNLTQPQ